MLRYAVLIDSIFCSNVSNVNIIQNTNICSKENCGCQNHFQSLLDLFSHLYYVIDGKNYSDFLSVIKLQNTDEIRERSKKIKEIWDGYILTNSYSKNEFRYLDPQSISIIKNDLNSQKNLEMLLISLVFWLKTLDNHFNVLNDYVRTNIIHKMVFETNHHAVLIRISSTIANYIFQNKYANPHINPNNNNLNKELKNIYFAKKSYDYYENVEHKFLSENEFNLSKNLTLDELKIGYLSGDFTISNYNLYIRDANDNEKYFSFIEPNNKEQYYQNVEKRFQTILEEDPHFIILPELFSPIDLQNNMRNQIEEYYDNKVSKLEEPSLILAFPGSFHDKEGKSIYNKSIISNGSGSKINVVYKHNEFKIYKNETYTGDLEVFQKFDGLEDIAINKRNITIYDTPIGRIAILICIDFLIDHIARVLEDRCVDLIFVMAMTPNPSKGKFERRIQEFSEKNNALIIIGNNGDSEVKNLISLPGYRESIISNSSCEVKKIKDYIGRN